MSIIVSNDGKMVFMVYNKIMGILCHFTCKSNERFENKFEAMDRGENGQIAPFCKLCCNLSLF